MTKHIDTLKSTLINFVCSIIFAIAIGFMVAFITARSIDSNASDGAGMAVLFFGVIGILLSFAAVYLVARKYFFNNKSLVAPAYLAMGFVVLLLLFWVTSAFILWTINSDIKLNIIVGVCIIFWMSVVKTLMKREGRPPVETGLAITADSLGRLTTADRIVATEKARKRKEDRFKEAMARLLGGDGSLSRE